MVAGHGGQHHDQAASSGRAAAEAAAAGGLDRASPEGVAGSSAFSWAAVEGEGGSGREPGDADLAAAAAMYTRGGEPSMAFGLQPLPETSTEGVLSEGGRSAEVEWAAATAAGDGRSAAATRSDGRNSAVISSTGAAGGGSSREDGASPNGQHLGGMGGEDAAGPGAEEEVQWPTVGESVPATGGLECGSADELFPRAPERGGNGGRRSSSQSSGASPSPSDLQASPSMVRGPPSFSGSGLPEVGGGGGRRRRRRRRRAPRRR